MDTKDLRCFCRVYEERGINQAAKQLFISPQGLSRIITKLEAELQVTLFCRSARGLSPTASGTYLYENGRELLNRLEELEIGIRRMERIDRELQLGFSCGVLNVFPFQQLDQFKSENPDIHLQWEELENQEVIDRILRRVVDVGFVIGSIQQEGLYAREVYQSGMDALVYEGHPFYDREQLSVDDLRDEPLIILNERYSCYHSFLSRCKDFGFIPLIHIKLMESQLIYRFCREKLGIGIDTNIHKQDISMEHLHRVKLYDAFSWKISIVCREDRKKEKLIKKLLDQF
ncbi:MAG: LysR family transcriptional regulator [Lachnospiraceae bacterium]|nr:LysR family transcriptional regulator [Lachnospiraceae bacterium]